MKTDFENEANKKFGIPEVDNTPMGIIKMEGSFLSGLTDTKSRSSQSVFVKIIKTLFFFSFLFIGVVSLFLSFLSYKEDGLFSVIGPIFFGILFTGCALGIFVSLQKKK